MLGGDAEPGLPAACPPWGNRGAAGPGASPASVSLCAPGGASCPCPCVTSQQLPGWDPRVEGGRSAGSRAPVQPCHPRSHKSSPCAGSGAGGNGPPPGPCADAGPGGGAGSAGACWQSFFFSSSIKHFPPLEPQGGFGWEATWPRHCRPRDASRGGGTSPWPWAGSPPRSPCAAHRVLPGLQQLRSHPASPAGWPGGCRASVSPSLERQCHTLGADGVTPGKQLSRRLPHPEGAGQRRHLGKLRHLGDPSESAGRQ